MRLDVTEGTGLRPVKRNHSGIVFVNGDEDSRIRVYVEDILYVEAQRNYSEIVILQPDGREWKAVECCNLAWCARKLDGYGFIRAGRSLLVNPIHIERIYLREARLYMENQREFKLTRQAAEELVRHLDSMGNTRF